MKKLLEHLKFVIILVIIVFRFCIVSSVALASDPEEPPILNEENIFELYLP